jgi:DNA repair protein RadC
MNKVKTVKLVKLKMVCEDMGVYSHKIKGCADIVELVRPIFAGSFCEMVVVVCVNNQNRPTAVSIVNIGSVNQSFVSPGNVFKLALLSNSSGIFLVHNHPSGSEYPSSADKEITSTLQKGGKLLELDFIDHVIVVGPACTSHFSFRENGLL